MLAGCGERDSEPDEAEDVLLTVGDSTLTMADVLRHVPAGLDRADSLRMIESLCDSWLRTRLLEDLGRRNIPDMEEIERLAQDYRNRLIVMRYCRMMREDNPSAVSEDSVRRYYLRNMAEMLLDRPLVKGIYIKVADDASQLSDVRRWVRTASQSAVDNLERYGLRNAMQYDYFMDAWVDWESIADRIPYRFGDAEAFLKENRDFETTAAGAIYMLHISDYLPAGNPMPYSFAASRIRELLAAKADEQFERNLINSLYRDARKAGRLDKGLYDPSTGHLTFDSETKK